MSTSGEPTERSPLLQNVASHNDKFGPSITGSLPNEPITDGAANSTGATADGDEELQGQRRNYQGMPDVYKKMKYILPALGVGIFMSAGDQTIIVSSYGKIGSDLKALNSTSWIATAYFLTLTSFQPLYGKFSDIFGRKQALLFAYTIFGLGCLWCGLARSMNELIVARAFAGIGGGGMTTVVSILLSDVIPLRNRGTWQGYVNIIFATGSGCGAPLGCASCPQLVLTITDLWLSGGILADYVGWRWSFLGQAPLSLIAIVCVVSMLQLPKDEDVHWKAKLKRVDFLGALVLISAVFTLILGLDHGSNVSWSAPLTLSTLCVSPFLFAIFVFVEMRVAAEPFAPAHVVFERSLLSCYLCNFFSFGGWLSAIYYIPLFYQAVDGLTATQAGVRLLPGIVAGVSGSLASGVFMQKTGKYYWLTVGAYTWLTLGLIPIILFTGLVGDSTWGISVGLAICGFSNGVGVTTSLIALISNADQADQAIATACSYLFRSLGSVVGLSLTAAVVQHSLRVQLNEALGDNQNAEEIVKRVRESLDFIKSLEPDVRHLVTECYGGATRASFVLSMGIVACAMLSSFGIREKRLSR
ncbi:MAG: hypothetical protein M1837_002698 [Sclerophora amabilis]|nr:MAG: hypothetical protein M1837_002698 [Sclerophora amabilis]